MGQQWQPGFWQERLGGHWGETRLGEKDHDGPRGVILAAGIQGWWLKAAEAPDLWHPARPQRFTSPGAKPWVCYILFSTLLTFSLNISMISKI